jgi:superoxide dismutase, Cu-Zn family
MITAETHRFRQENDMHKLPTAAILLCGALAAEQVGAAQATQANEPAARTYAEAIISGIGDSKVHGQLTFRHAAPFVFIEGRVEGLSPGKYGMHVHEGTSCSDRGGHYNPTGAPHGSPDQPHDMRHVGDLGNLVAGKSGSAHYARIDALTRLHGPHSVVGRVIVVHSSEDDYMSQPAGNSGEPIGCGVIRRVSPTPSG